MRRLDYNGNEGKELHHLLEFWEFSMPTHRQSLDYTLGALLEKRRRVSPVPFPVGRKERRTFFDGEGKPIRPANNGRTVNCLPGDAIDNLLSKGRAVRTADLR